MMNRLCCFLVGMALVGPASAHDTWFEALPNGTLALGTGNRFPVFEFPLGYEYVVGSGCRGEGASAAPLAHVEDRPTALVVRSATPLKAGAALTCWAALTPFDVVVPPDKIEVY